MKYPCIVIATQNHTLDVVDIDDVKATFDQAKDVWTSRGGPEMWIFDRVGEAGWHSDSTKKIKGKKT